MERESADYTNFRKSLMNLQARHRDLLALPADASPETIELYRESLIQRFEVCYDQLWKALRRYLITELDTQPSSIPVRILRLAGEAGIMVGSPVRWRDYIKARNNTTHTYDEELTLAALDLMPSFINDATELYEAITGEALR